MNEQVSELSREELLQRYAKPSKPAAASQRRSPFKFLDSYDVDDADIFFGRDTEIEELLGRFHGTGHVLIYGESGSGKSSLVQCGLRSRIPAADALFIPLRVHTAGLPTVSQQICTHAFQALDESVEVPDNAGLVETLRAVREAASRPLVLFFDQFEELFIFHDSETRRRFAEELAAIPKSKLNVKIVIGVRQDYLAHLSELEETVEGLFDNRFWLRRMSRENAAEGVVKACATCNVKVDDDLAESILHRLDPAGQGVELPYLQVVMDRLYRRAVEANPARPVISAADVENLGHIANILGSFLVEEVEKLPSPDTGRQILKAFVTREGTRRTLDRDAVAREAAGFGGAVSDVDLEIHLAQLANVRVLREIADSGTYELRHDALAATVAGWISEVEKELIEVRDNLVNRHTEYEARERERTALLDEAFLDYLGVYQTRLSPLLNESQREYLEASSREVKRRKRVRQLSIGGGVLFVLLVAFLFLGNYARTQERLAKAEGAKFDKARTVVNEFFVTVSEETLLNQPGLQDLRATLLEEARKFYEYFLQEANKDAHPDDHLLRELARTHYYLGEITRETEGDQESLKRFQDALDIQLELMSRNQEDPDGLLYDLGNTLNAMGRAHDNLTNREAALRAYEQALTIREQLARNALQDSEYQRKVASTMMNIGLVKRSIDQDNEDANVRQEAIELFNKAQDKRREEVEKLETHLDKLGMQLKDASSRSEIERQVRTTQEFLFRMQRDRAMGFYNLAELENQIGNSKDAKSAYCSAIDLFQKCLGESNDSDTSSTNQWGKPNDLEVQFKLGVSYLEFGQAVYYEIWGENKELLEDPDRNPEDYYLKAQRILEKLADGNPAVNDYQVAVATLYIKLGGLYTGWATVMGTNEDRAKQMWKTANDLGKQAMDKLEPLRKLKTAYDKDWTRAKALKEKVLPQPTSK